MHSLAGEAWRHQARRTGGEEGPYVARNTGAIEAAGAAGLLGAEGIGQGLGGLRVLHNVATISSCAVGRLDDLVLHRTLRPANKCPVGNPSNIYVGHQSMLWQRDERLSN